MDQLLNLTTIKRMRRSLESLPIGLHEAYKSSLDRIMIQHPSRAALALRVIGWATHAERPLSIDEILHAFALEEDCDEFDEENLTSSKILLQVCVGLVTIKEEDSTIRMVHATAHDFFRSLAEKSASIEEDIAKTCLGYLCLRPLAVGPCTDVESLNGRLRDMPFLAYAAQQWGIHVQRVEKQSESQILKLLENPSLVASSFQALQHRKRKHRELAIASFEALPTGQGPLHVAASWGLTFTAQSMLAGGVDPSPKDAQGWTPLHWACSNSHKPMADLLVKYGADLYSRDSQGWTPLFWASYKGNVQIVNFLLEQHADHLIVDNHGWTALHWAVSRGEKETVNALVAHHTQCLEREERFELPIRSIAVDEARQLGPGKSSPIELATEEF